jgi:hypothetical protein
MAGDLMHHNLKYLENKKLTKVNEGKTQMPGKTGSTPSILRSCAVFILAKYSKFTIKPHKFSKTVS